MFKRGSKAAPTGGAQDAPQPKSADEWFDEVRQAHPEWDVMTVSDEAFRLYEAQQRRQPPGPRVAMPAEGAKPGRRLRWPFGPVATLLAGVAVIAAILLVLFLVVLPRLNGGATPTTPAEATEPAAAATLDEIRFAGAPPAVVIVGEAITLPLELLDASGRRLNGQKLEIVLTPPDAGTARISMDGDGTRVRFTAGDRPGEVSIVVHAADDSTIATPPLRLMIGNATTLALALEPPISADLRPGQPFPMRFIVTNNGQTVATDVQLAVVTPPELELDEATTLGAANQECARTDEGIHCRLQDISIGSRASITAYYRAPQPGPVGFDPRHYRLSYAGGNPLVINSTAATLWSADVPAPQPATLAVVASPAELPADGETTAAVRVSIENQWGGTYDDAARVVLAARRPGAEPAAAAATPGPSLSCRTIADSVIVRERIATDEAFLLSPAIGESLASGVNLTAFAYRPSGDRLFVEVQETPPRRGWVTITLNSVARIQCDGELATLPEAVAPTNPDGVVDPAGPVDVSDGQAAFTYTAGGAPGALELVAHLVDEAGAPIGEPWPATIQLLEQGWLQAPSHLYAEAGDAAADNGANVVARGLPIGTALELYPESADTPGARQAAVRLWLPVGALAGEATPAVTTTTDQPVRVGATPDDALNSQTGAGIELRLGERALDSPVVLLGDEVNGYRPARLIVWVPTGKVYIDR